MLPDDRLHDLIARMVEDPAWLSDLMKEMASRVSAEFPGSYADSAARDLLVSSVESVLHQLVYNMRDRLPPEEVRLAPATLEKIRANARHDVPLDQILRGVQIGHGIFLSWAISTADESASEPEELLVGLARASDWLFEYVQALSSLLVRCYTEERDLWVGSAAARRLDAVESLLAGERAEAAAIGLRLGYDLANANTAVVLWAPASAAPDALGRAARLVGELAQVERPLIVSLPGRLEAVWLGTPPGREPPSLDGLDTRLPEGVRASVGDPAHGPDGFAASHLQADEARRVAELGGEDGPAVTWYREVSLEALAASDPERARRFAVEELGSLAGDEASSATIRATLAAYLELGLSPRAAARALGVHENTVVNRVRSAREQLPGPIEDRVAELLVALRITRALAPEKT